MKEIVLTQGKFAQVDDEDFEFLNQWKWYALKSKNTFYAVRNIGIEPNRTAVRMHNVILKNIGIDHIDHDGLNNQRLNLRHCTGSENQMNRNLKSGLAGTYTSSYKGVSWHKAANKWYASIRYDGRQRSLGVYVNEIEAAIAYNKEASQRFGEFAFLNVIPNLELHGQSI